MTTISTTKSDTRFLGLPRNKTGLFAADTIQEVKPTRNHLISVPSLSTQFRNNGSMNVLLASSEQNHHQLQQYQSSKTEIQQYYPLDGGNGSIIDSSNDSRITLNGIRNGFRPSTVRHQKLRLTTATAQRNNIYYENIESPPKSAVMQSQASAKLRSEINHINHKLKRHGESSKSLRVQNIQDTNATPRSALSYSTSCRLSSASTLTANRIHQRFSSAITNVTANTRATVPTRNEMSNQTTQFLEGIAATPSSLPPNNETNQTQQDTTDYEQTHAYQIPQQSNVGSESIFLTEPPLLSPIKTRSAKNDRRPYDSKSVSCPFYVMYFTNLAMQQRQSKDNYSNTNENDVTSLAMASTHRKVPVNSRTSTSHPKRQSARRQLTSPISINTYSTIDDDDIMPNSLPFPNNKRSSARVTTVENENSQMLRDILRTSSWNHVQV